MASPLLQTDFLHPLAMLQWKHCHKPPWRGMDGPTHCAALQNTVAVLSSDGDVFVSSTDFCSWTKTIAPFRQMSLTTYRYNFVLVGGRCLTTSYVTNKLLTSTTGQQWEPSLPPMPTKRCQTSSVSTRSQEMLVVAGGKDLNNENIGVVEVLLDDRWTTVDPLPAPVYEMHSAHHDGNLHFMGGEEQDTMVYTCSCSSLVSSVKATASTNSTESLLWRQYQAPRHFTAAVSSSSRLANIDGKGTVRGFCNISQSWVEASSTGDIPPREAWNIAATVLTTGDIIYFHEEGGVYRVSLSMSCYSSDIEFPRYALTRLEAVMGIQIVSVLAKLQSPLTSSSGVKLQPYVEYDRYEPDQYVVELVLQWYDRRSSHRPPTWIQLLNVLQDIGLIPLSLQIDEFLKGDVKFTNAYRHFVNTKDVLEILFIKMLFFGPPRFGKTSARRRLEGEIVDLMSAGEANIVHPSTGAVETGPGMIIQSVSSNAAVVTTRSDHEWHAVKSPEEEAGMLLHNLADNLETRNVSIPRAMDVKPLGVAGAERVTANSPTIASPKIIEKPDSEGLGKKIFSIFTSFVTGEQVKPQPTESQSSESQPSESQPSESQPTESQPRDNPEVVHLFQEALKQPNFWKNVKKSFRAYIRIEDTGGQPELMDMLPALTLGPALCLLFLNLEWNLEKEFTVSYQHPSGKTTAPEESKITLEEMLFATLSSISCSSSSAQSLKGKEANSSDIREILKSSKSAVYIVGTHKDKVTKEQISKFDSDLQSIIEGTDFFEKEIVQFISEGKLIMAMDNMTGGVEEVHEVRRTLHKAMEKHFRKLKIPAAWLLFNQCLQMRKKRTASFESCLELSTQLNMSAYETKVALWFLHHHAGVLMYFPDILVLADLVILDNQVVYDSVTFLILRAMSFDCVGQARAEKFKKTGQFVIKDLVAATSHISGDIIPPEKLLALLEFLHMVAPIVTVQDSVCSTERENKINYFMPCVLRTASKEKLDAIIKDRSCPECIAPLMIRYKCGFVPLGIFPALIASLIGNKTFAIVEEDMMKNKIRFYFGSLQILVTFLCYPKFYVIVISELPIVEHELHEQCVALRKAVVASLEQVNCHMNYGFFLDYQFAFECPSHPGREHLCVVEGALDNVTLMMCYQKVNHKKPVKMGSIHEIWFHKGKFHTSLTSLELCSTSILCTDQSLSCGVILQVLHKDFPSSKAKELGYSLGLPRATLEEFIYNNPRDCKSAMCDIINWWLANDKDKSWMKLAGAVEVCGHASLAGIIRLKYGVTQPTQHNI